MVCFLPIFEYKPLNLMILQHTKVIPLLDVVYLPGKRDPSWEQCSRAPYTFQALVSHIKRVQRKGEVDENKFCVSTNVIIDNFEKEDQVKDNLKNNPNCEVKRDEKQLKQPKKQNYMQTLLDIFDEVRN